MAIIQDFYHERGVAQQAQRSGVQLLGVTSSAPARLSGDEAAVTQSRISGSVSGRSMWIPLDVSMRITARQSLWRIPELPPLPARSGSVH